MSDFNWIVSQIGARQHYGIPRGFEYTGSLGALYTDVWCRLGRPLLKHGTKLMRAYATRYHPHIPSAKVKSFDVMGTRREILAKRASTAESRFQIYEETGAWFASRVTAHLRKHHHLDPNRDCFFGFNTGCLETQQYLREQGVISVVDQIDPGKFEEELVYEEGLRWPGWEELPGRIPDRYFERLAREWELAEMVLVNSRWSKDALIKQGVPREKIIIVALAYEPESIYVRPKDVSTGPLKVLWLGQVNLRKGIQYLIGAAKLLKDANVQFTIAGGLFISQQALATAPPNMNFIGQVTRDRLHEVYRSADVFVLPTLSDGFAITQVEAMGFGLPVITTPNCGEVVTEGVDGLIVPAANAEALAAAIARLAADRSLLAAMSHGALEKATRFRLPVQAEQLERAVIEYRRGGRGEQLQQVIDAVNP